MNAAFGRVSLAVYLAMVMVRCDYGDSSSVMSKADPTSSAGPVAASEIDALPLSDADLESMDIVYARQAAETKAPDWGGINQSIPCQQSEWVSALQPSSAFRMVDSDGPSNFAIHQTVAIYPDEQSLSRYSRSILTMPLPVRKTADKKFSAL